MIGTYVFECSVHFLSEQRTELYEKYNSGVAELKNMLSAKSSLQTQALLELERCGT